MNLVGRLRAAKKAEAKAAATAPARFRRITKRSKVTAPCVLARKNACGKWIMHPMYTAEYLSGQVSYYTHWLPIQWPEVRG